MVRPWFAVLGLAVAAPAQDRSWTAALDRLVAAPALAGARVGVVVLDLATPTAGPLLARDADQGFMTASNMKLITVAVALATLGPEFTFTTRLCSTVPPRDGVVDGDLVLVGDGDPTLGGRPLADPMLPFATMARELAAAGIREVRGRVLGCDDCQAEESLGNGWQWDYLDADYAAPFGGLCFAENVATLKLRAGAAGEPVQLRAVPVPFLQIRGEARTVPAGMAAELRLVREPFADVVRIDGALAADAGERTFRIAVRDPSRFAADALRTALRREGIRVTGSAGTADEQPAPLPRGRFVELSRWVSESLRKVAVPTLKDSQNLYAEQLFRTAARVAGGPSDSAGAAGHAAQVLRSLGVDTTGIYLADGSGLSRRNLVRPRQLAELLAALWRGPHRAVVLDALPVAGQDGTLQNRFATGPARGRVRAKTGFIARVVGLSGYVPRPDPGAAPLAFAVLLNNFTGSDAEAKAAADAFVTELARSVGLPEPAATGPRPAGGRRLRRNRRRGGERSVRLDEAPRGGVRRLRS